MKANKKDADEILGGKMGTTILFVVVCAATVSVFGIDLHQKRNQLLTKR